MYRCETGSVEGFVQHVAVNLIPHGYFFYVTGEIPEGKEVHAVDSKLITRYGLQISRWIRCRRRKEGVAGGQYVRHGRFFILIATEGEHPFLEKEASRLCDIRRKPLQCFGYSIGCYRRKSGKWHPSVRIGKQEFASLSKSFREQALSRTNAELWKMLHALPFAPFAPVRNQSLSLLRTVNTMRRQAGLPLVVADCVRRRRNPIKVFLFSKLRS